MKKEILSNPIDRRIKALMRLVRQANLIGGQMMENEPEGYSEMFSAVRIMGDRIEYLKSIRKEVEQDGPHKPGNSAGIQ